MFTNVDQNSIIKCAKINDAAFRRRFLNLKAPVLAMKIILQSLKAICRIFPLSQSDFQPFSLSV